MKKFSVAMLVICYVAMWAYVFALMVNASRIKREHNARMEKLEELHVRMQGIEKLLRERLGESNE